MTALTSVPCSGPPAIWDLNINDPLGIYLTSLNHVPRLSREEEAQLGERSRAGDAEAQAALVQSNLRLGVAIAKRYIEREFDLLDLIQQANLGLMEAAKRWDPERGKFSTYAVFWIRSSISRSFVGATYQKRRRFATVEDLRRLHYGSLTETESAEELMEREATWAEIRAAVMRLCDREREVITRHYGLNGEPESLTDIAREWGLSRERLRQVKERGLDHLRQLLSSEARV